MRWPVPRRLAATAAALAVLALLSWLLWRTLLRTVETVDTVPVTRGDIEATVAAVGTLQPLSYVDVGAQVSGQIRRIAVQPGSVVGKGDLLVEIDPAVQQAKVDTDRAALDSLRAQLELAQAQHELAQHNALRQRLLVAQHSTTLQEAQTAEAELRVAEARMADLRAQIAGAQSVLKGDEALLGYTRIYAPMAGTVVTLDARAGQTLNAAYQTPTLLRIADLARMTVWTEVSEADIGKVRPGMPVYFTTLGGQDGVDARRWQGHVRQILPAPPRPQGQGDAAALPAAGAAGKVVLYTVLFDTGNADGALMPQMSAQVFFVQAYAADALVAPATALQAMPGRPGAARAQVLEHGRVVLREVRTGVRDRLRVQVLSGLEEGEPLVTAVRRERAGAGRFRW